MYDDGAHNDGAANDGVYGASISMNSPSIQYYVYAQNSTIGKFSPLRAEYEYYRIDAVGELVINEFMADNDGAITDQHGDYEDWIELYNNSNDSIFLGDYFLSDDITEPDQWQMNAEYLPAGGFKLIWASGDTTKGTNHSNFKLSKGGEEIGLFKQNAANLDTADYISFGTQSTDVSYGREYDASPNWIFFNNSTPDASNGTIGLKEIENSGLLIYPNPYQSRLIIENPTEEKASIVIYSSIGQVLEKVELMAHERMEWNDRFSSGIRIVKIQSELGNSTLKLIAH